MKTKGKFPQFIHVEREIDGKDSYLIVHEAGVYDVDEPDTILAVYKLVEVGTVQIQKHFKKIHARP